MINIKILLRLLGTFSLTTVLSTSVIACYNDPDKNKIIMIQVWKDFGFIDSEGNSLVDLHTTIDNETKLAKWQSDSLTWGVAASNLLLTDDNLTKAKSVDSSNFLVDILKLKAESGVGADRLFKRIDADLIKLKIKEYLPKIIKNSNNSNYKIDGGTISIKFVKDNIQLGKDYSLNIYGSTKNIIQWPLSIKLDDFNNIPEFLEGKPKSSFPVDKDLTQFFKFSEVKGKQIKSFVDLIKQGELKFKVSEAADGSGNFAKGDIIKIKISIGEVTFSKQRYELTIG